MIMKMTKWHRTNSSFQLPKMWKLEPMLQSVFDKKGVSEYATSWLVSLWRRLGYRRAMLQSDGEPSIVPLKTVTLLASPSVELVFRESPVGEHATNGVAESAMREVKRQTRTLKFALEGHVGKIVESHSILKWIPTMAADAISFFRIGRETV